MRVYDPRIRKFLSVDPLTKKYPELTSYQFASNTPVMGIDLDGEEVKVTIDKLTKTRTQFELQGSVQIHYKVLNLSSTALTQEKFNMESNILNPRVNSILSREGVGQWGDSYPNGKIAATGSDIVHYTFKGKMNVITTMEMITSIDQIKKGGYVMLILDGLSASSPESIIGKTQGCLCHELHRVNSHQ